MSVRTWTPRNKKPRIASGFSTAAGALPDSDLVVPEQPASKRALMRDRSVAYPPELVCPPSATTRRLLCPWFPAPTAPAVPSGTTAPKITATMSGASRVKLRCFRTSQWSGPSRIAISRSDDIELIPVSVVKTANSKVTCRQLWTPELPKLSKRRFGLRTCFSIPYMAFSSSACTCNMASKSARV